MDAIIAPPRPPVEPPEDERGDGECWRCGGSGFAGEWLSEAEAQHTFGHLVPEWAGFVSMHTTYACPECPAGWRIRTKMRGNE